MARLNHDISQATASRAIGRSGSAWSRLERGEALHLPLRDLVRAAAVVGLDLSVRAYPAGRAIRDEAHVRLLGRFRSRLGRGVTWRIEVPLPNPGDRRAWDAVAGVEQSRIGIEAETRARDSQELQRRLTLKQRDGGVDSVILLLANTRHNRAFVAAAGASFAFEFPVPGVVALERLSAGREPGGNAIVLL